jgi:hypothetical protein
MRRLCALCLVIGTALAAVPIKAQILDQGFINAGTTCATTGACVSAVVGQSSSITIQIVGTFSATLSFEATADGTTWVAAQAQNLADGTISTSTTAAGAFSLSNVGVQQVRVRASAYTSGGAQVSFVRGYGTVRWQGFSSLTVGSTLTVGDAIVLGAPTTSGVRLDLESGSLAVREGDDSGYVQINSGTINSTGEGIFAGNVNSDGVFRDGGNGMRFDMGTDNRARIADNGVTNTFDITLADWGTTLSAEAVPLANDASVLIGAATAGTVHVSYPGDAAIYMARGTSNSTRLADGSATFTTTKDNAGTVNFYYDNGYYLQNKTGGSLSFRVKLAGG